ncbi:MAG: NAD-dependent epimerase/dehydratase family protein [Bacteroidales bacterium]
MVSSILITGGCGFVGSNLAFKLKNKYPGTKIIVFDNLMRRGSELNISRLCKADIIFIHGDVRNKEDFNKVGDVELIIDAAAEPSVMAGVNGNTDYLIHTNFNGTINCLDYAVKNNAAFIFLSTSRVYSIDELERIPFSENNTRYVINDKNDIRGLSEKGICENFSTYGYKSLYGASKFCSENFIEEYARSFGLKTIINRCSVLAGPYQYGKADQGFAVLWVARHFWKQKLTYIGYGGLGKQVRDILYIDDLFQLVDFQINNLDSLTGKLYNAGGGLEKSVSLCELTTLCQEITGNKIQIDRIAETRQADIRLYITDNSKITKETHWMPTKSVRDTVIDIFTWIKENEDAVKPILF